MPGLDGVYAGFTVPLAEPAIGVLAVALRLLIGRDLPHRVTQGAPLYLAGLAAGLLAARPLTAVVPTEPALLALAALAGALSALTGDRATPLALGLLPMIGLGMGAACLPDPGPAAAMLGTGLGALAGAHIVLLPLCGAADMAFERLPRGPVDIGLRIAASWLAALALLMLALVLAGPVG